MSAPVWPQVMVTGHRPHHLPVGAPASVRGELDRIAVKLRDGHGMTAGITGMALGADLLWAASLHRAQVSYIAHIPFPEQPDPWRRNNPHAVTEWERLRGLADREVVYGTLAGLAERARKGAAVKLLHRRNDGMLAAVVSARGAVVAVWCPSKLNGGTHSALQKAHRLGLPVIHINPEARTTTVPSRARLSHLLHPTAPDELPPTATGDTR
ncbi:hypothetical protein ACH4T9_12500 [Micromonospora sp. NPDC020750]|uniref:hypothetical protein n=1 Tax=unclassified Micromonospora TaxID=2617518 RepID=UPI003791A4AC